ncbi:MAG: hypothetical protein WDZ28_04840 [Simkaniaceae bacterium]
MALPQEDFKKEIYGLFHTIKEIQSDPKKSTDYKTLGKLALIIRALDAAAKLLLDHPDETLRYDACLITNMLETPITPVVNIEKKVIPLKAAETYLNHKEKESDLEQIVKACVKDNEIVDQFLSDLTDILDDLKTMKEN